MEVGTLLEYQIKLARLRSSFNESNQLGYMKFNRATIQHINYEV